MLNSITLARLLSIQYQYLKQDELLVPTVRGYGLHRRDGQHIHLSEWKHDQHCVAQGWLVCGPWLAHACQKLYLQAAAGISLPGRAVGRCCLLYQHAQQNATMLLHMMKPEWQIM